MNKLQTQKTLSFFFIAVVLITAAYAIDRIKIGRASCRERVLRLV